MSKDQIATCQKTNRILLISLVAHFEGHVKPFGCYEHLLRSLSGISFPLSNLISGLTLECPIALWATELK